MPPPLVLIADPHEATRELLADVVQHEFGAITTLLIDASALGSALLEMVPTLVIVEISRDRMSDAAAIEELKKANPQIPFLVLSAHGLNDLEIEERTGADVVIGKPFELEQVLDEIRRLLSPRGKAA